MSNLKNEIRNWMNLLNESYEAPIEEDSDRLKYYYDPAGGTTSFLCSGDGAVDRINRIFTDVFGDHGFRDLDSDDNADASEQLKDKVKPLTNEMLESFFCEVGIDYQKITADPDLYDTEILHHKMSELFELLESHGYIFTDLNHEIDQSNFY